MKKLLTILGSLGMIVPVSASVVACNGSDDKETLRSSDQWGDGWGDENKQRPANPDDNWNDWGDDEDWDDDEDDWDDVDDAGGRPVTPGDEDDDDNDWGNDRDEDKDHHTGWDHNDLEYFTKMDFSKKSFEDLKYIIHWQVERKIWGIKCEIAKQGSLDSVMTKNPKLTKQYAEVIFNNSVARAKVFLETDYVVQYDRYDLDDCSLAKNGETSEKHSYGYWVEGTQDFMKAKLIPQVTKFYTTEQKDYLKKCSKALDKLLA